MQKPLYFFLLGMALVAIPLLAGADIYKYVDKHGRVHLTDRPDHSGYRRLVKTWKGSSATARNTNRRSRTRPRRIACRLPCCTR
jgi:hypothetical protein